METVFFQHFLMVWAGLAVAAFVGLFFLTVPYGRYFHAGWGPSVDAKFGWMIMESASAAGFALWFILGRHSMNAVPILFFCLWELHYIHRSFVYPMRMGRGRGRMPVLVAGFAFLFNTANAYLNGRYLFTLSGGYGIEWLLDVRFVAGAFLFLAGYGVNLHADTILLNLGKGGKKGYSMPQGGLFRWISCPNYFGEIIEWIGWAVLTWSPGGLVFALWTVANLTPRARDNHRWYLERFPDYPKERKALIPFVW